MARGALPLREWTEPTVRSVPPAASGVFSTHLFDSIVSTRFPEIASDAKALSRFLKPDVRNLGHPFDMPGVRDAAEAILRTVDSGGDIVVFGDFDADGVTATAILVDLLRRIGAKVRPFIPLRSEGYGLGKAAVARCLEAGAPKLLITVDCGIDSAEALGEFIAVGASVIVSDHHIPGRALPPECIVVSTYREGVPECRRDICGAGLAYNIAYGVTLLKYPPPDRRGRVELVAWLEALAVATVADVVPLTGENRLYVTCGLHGLNRTFTTGHCGRSEAPRTGLRELCKAAFPALPGKITADHLGFVFGPHINSAGRMRSAESALGLLLACNVDEAHAFAVELKQTNSLRKSDDAAVTKAAEEMISAGNVFDEERDGAVVVAGEGWAAGVVGLAASRLSGKYNRPAVVISTGPDGIARGSIRAPKGYNAYAALAESAGLLEGFGGHECAAGLLVATAKVDEFRRAFADACARQVGAVSLRPEMGIDSWLEPGDIDLSLLTDLDTLGPFGEGNPEPVFAIRDAEVRAYAVGKEEKKHLGLRIVRKDGIDFSGIWFDGAQYLAEFSRSSHWDVAGTLMQDSFMGETSVKLRVIDARPSAINS